MMNPSSEKKCLIVLGMHRSGTSALSGALSIAGLNPGKQLFDPEEDNPKGNYENARITKLNENILTELFAKWNDTLLIPDEWWNHDKFEDYSQQLSRILQDEIENGNSSVLIKDPRLSVLLPLYLIALRKLNVNPSFVVCIRNPYEVADSLKKRNNLSREKSLLLWIDYQVKAEYYSRNYPRIFLSYYEFLKDPGANLRALQENISPGLVLSPEIEREILSFLDRGLKHHNLEDQLPDNAYLPKLNVLFELFKSANLRDLSASELVIIDQIRSEFFSTIKFFYGLAQAPEAVLTVYLNDNNKIILRTPVKYGNNKLEFAINPDIPVTRLKFNPISSWVGLKILSIEGTGPDKDSFQIKQSTTNSSFITADGIEVFETEMPEIIIDFPSVTNLSLIVFKLDYLAIGRITYRMASVHFTDKVENLISELRAVNIQIEEKNKELLQLQQFVDKQNNEIQGLSQVVKNQDDEIQGKNHLITKQDQIIKDQEHRLQQFSLQVDTIYNSLTWRSGRIITSPARLIYKVIGKS